MPDVELFDLGDRRDRADIEVREPVAGVDGQAGPPRVHRRLLKMDEGPVMLPPGVGVPAGVQLDRGNAEGGGRVDGAGIWVDEEGNANVGVLQPGDCSRQAPVAGLDGEPPLRGDLLTALRDERRLVRPELCCDPHDFGTRRELEVQNQSGACRERLHVGVLNVTAVLAEVHGDTVGPAGQGVGGGADRVGLVGLPRFADSRDVINVDVQAHEFLPSVQPAHHEVKDVFRRIVLLAPLLVACGGGRAASTTPVPTDPNVALNQFLTAVKNKDIKGMSDVWGDENDLEVNLVKPDAFRMRVYPLQIYLSNRGFRVIQGPNPVPAWPSRRSYKVELKRSTCSLVVDLTVAQMKRGGWVFQGTDLTDVSNASKACNRDPSDAAKP